MSIAEKVEIPNRLRRAILALTPVLVAFLAQWMVWTIFRPLAWFLFYPAVFFSSWIGGRRLGIFATFITTLLVWYFFLPPEGAIFERNALGVVSALTFLGTGVTFSIFHDRLKRANLRVAEALAVNRYQAQLESAFNSIQEGIVVTDMEGAFLLVNEAEARMNGFSSAEAMKQGLAFYRELYELSYPDGRPLPFEEWPIKKILRGESIRNWELRARRRDSGQEWFLNFSGQPVCDERGKQILAVIGISDITERKRAEEALRESQARTAGIIESAMDAIVSVDADHRIVVFNSAAEKMFQCPVAEAIGQPLDRFIPPQFRHAHHQHIADFGQTHVTRRTMGALGAAYGLRANGGEFPIEASISQIETNGEKIFTVILRDITQRKRDEERLRQQAAMLNQAQEAILVRDLDDGIRFWNRGAERLYGWKAEEVIDRPLGELLYRGDSSQLDEAIKTVIEKGDWAGEIRQFTRDGRELTVEAHWTLIRDEQGAPKSILAINNDITEKKGLEAQFLRAQRLESLGTLAGGIAHDLNNILSPIMMGAQMLQIRHADEFSQKMLGLMAENAERGAAMIRQILSFARGVGGERVVVHPQFLVKEIVKMIRDTFPKEITIKQQLGADLWPIEGDPTQLHQVLMNLCVNARDAMPRGGDLTVRVENQTFDELSALMSPEARAGDYVVITVADTGSGIAPENLERIFDPFFTTKELGKGTGLGLATVYGIVKAHGGFINVYSEYGAGARFKIYLPAQATQRVNQEKGDALRSTPVGRGELILVVDDEASIREMTRSALEAHGYRVLTAEDGAEAINLYAQRKGEVQIVLTDMMMPIMDGPTTIRALRSLNPQVSIVGSSGLIEERKANEARQLGVDHILAKPYNTETLLKTIAQAIRKNG